MSSRKYRVEQGETVLGHFAGHSFQEVIRKALDTQAKYNNYFDENKPFLLTRGSKMYESYADGREC